jgi:HEAT repeat protein
MKRMFLVAACLFLFQNALLAAESKPQAKGLQPQKKELPRAFLKKVDSKVVINKGGTISLSATKATLETILQKIAEERNVALRFYCDDPSRDQELRTFDNITADSFAKTLQQLLPEGCRFSSLNREGKETESMKEIVSVHVYSKGCADTGRPVRVISSERIDRSPGQPPDDLSPEGLREALKSGGPATRRKAAHILGIKGDEKAIPLAKEAIKDANPEVMFAAANALTRLGKKFGPQKVSDAIYGRFLEKPYPEFLPYMAEVDKDNIWAIFDKFIDQSDEREKGIMTRSLLLTGDRRAVKYLSTFASSGNIENSRQAIYAMGRIGGPEAANSLKKLIRDGDSQRQAIAVQATFFLPQGEGEDVRAEIAKVVKEGRASDTTLQALVGGGFLEPLEKLMRDPETKPDMKVRVLKAMAERGSEKAIPLMALGLQDSSVEVRLASVKAMESLTAESAIPHLVMASQDKEAKIREAAVIALAEFPGDYQVVKALSKAIHDSNERVRRAAVDAIAMLGKPGKEVIELLDDCEKNHKDPYVAKKAGHILKSWNVK